MAVSQSALAQLTRSGSKPKKRNKAAEAGELGDKAAFKKKYGIAPKGTAPKDGWPASAYGFPLPPASHPQALRYAHAVVSRAHQNKKYPASKLAAQVKRAKAIIKRHNPDYKEARESLSVLVRESSRLREYVPSTPPGSWERISGLIRKAAQESKVFGGPVNDSQDVENSEDVCRSWDIYIYASYPETRSVVIANDKLGKLWQTSYSIKDGVVVFKNTKPVKLSFAAEACKALSKATRKAKETLRKISRSSLRESSTTKMREALHFRSKLKEADLEKGTARVIIIREGSGNPADKHYYSKECLQDAVDRKLFEGAQSYLDHPTKLEDEIIPERMVEKLAGWLQDVELGEVEGESGKKVACIEATFVIEPGNELVLTKLRAAADYGKRFPGDYIGLSINAAGVGSPAEINGKQYHRVDKITEVRSVDLVTMAGAGGKLLSLKESMMKDTKKKTARQALEADRKTLRAKLKEGLGLSAEQDKELDKALGIEDGGALDELLDKVTGAPSEDETEEGDLDEDDVESDDETDDDDKNDDETQDIDDTDDEDVEEMDEASLKKELKAARKRERVAKKAAKESRTKAREAQKDAQRARMKAEGLSRETKIKELIETHKVPESHRPRFSRELREAKAVSDMPMIAKDYVSAFLGGVASAGAPGTQAGGKRVSIECLTD